MGMSKLLREAQKEAQRQNPGVALADLDEEVDEILHDWQCDMAEDREINGEPEDTFCIEAGRNNCDDWGTGEGRYHGRF